MIVIYGKPNCSWCTKAKNLADRYELKYTYKDVTEAGVLDLLKESLPDVRTVPQIWWGNRHIGGYEQFAKEIEETLGNYGQGAF